MLYFYHENDLGEAWARYVKMSGVREVGFYDELCRIVLECDRGYWYIDIEEKYYFGVVSIVFEALKDENYWGVLENVVSANWEERKTLL